MSASSAQTAEEKPLKGWRHDIGLHCVKLGNLALITLPFAACWSLYYGSHILITPNAFQSAAVILLFAGLYAFFAHTYDALLVSIKRISEMMLSQILSILMADGFMFLVLWLLSGSFPNLLPAMLALGGQLALSAGWCLCSNRWYFRHFAGQKTALIYFDSCDIADEFAGCGLSRKFDVQRTCTVQECLEGNMSALAGMDTVFLYNVRSHERNIILKHCIENDICVYVIPRIGDVLMSSARRIHMFHLPILRVNRYRPDPWFTFTKRLFDIVSSLAVIIITSPLMLATAIAIKAQDGGPVFYKQTRLTKDGREFRIIKFRSMRTDAEKDGVARLSTGGSDDRITPVGRVIRACRLDELPQLFNILGGSMSVVGPRPERPEIAKQYEQELPEFALRLQAKAGLTGYAQVYGKYNSTPYDKLKMDLMYIAAPSLITDLKIIFATIAILFQKESTEGISEGTTTAMK